MNLAQQGQRWDWHSENAFTQYLSRQKKSIWPVHTEKHQNHV